MDLPRVKLYRNWRNFQVIMYISNLRSRWCMF